MSDYIEINWDKQSKTNIVQNIVKKEDNNSELLSELNNEIKQIKSKINNIDKLNNEISKLNTSLDNLKTSMLKTISNIRSNFERLSELNIKAIKKKPPVNVEINLDELKLEFDKLSTYLEKELNDIKKQIFTIITKLDDTQTLLISSTRQPNLSHINNRLTSIEEKINKLTTLIEKNLNSKKEKSWFSKLFGV
jgi:F0F1-type ATP synthase membrane subunit b/b'